MVTVRSILYIVLPLLLLVKGLKADDTRVSVKLNDNTIFSDQEIKGTITVQHNKDDIVDVNSFNLESKPLAIQLIKNVEISPESNLVITFYSFQLPGQQPGLHILPGITLKIGDKQYTTSATTYEVKARSKMVKGVGGVVLQLETFTEGNLPLYVGQEINVGYRIFFNGNIELTEQILPLLDAKGFKKIGSERIGDVREGGMSVRQIEQKIEAIKPGTYTFGPSHLTGYIYKVGWSGKKQAIGNNITAEAAPVTIIVLDFPKQGQPASFNGSVGQEIDFKVSLNGSTKATVGDKLTLSIVFSSPYDLTNIKLPELCCQPGFPGFFELDDLPPLPIEKDGSLKYTVDLRPLVPAIEEIPSIEFSYFSPNKKGYQIKTSQAIPIEIKPFPDVAKEKSNVSNSADSDVLWPATTSEAEPIEIHTFYPLNTSDLKNTLFGTWAVFLVLPLGGLLIYLQLELRNKQRKKLLAKGIKNSHYWFNKAKNSVTNPSQFYHYIQQALIHRLYEKEWIDSTEITPQQIPKKGTSRRIREFLCAIEKTRFTKKKEQPTDQIIAEAEYLFHEVDERGKEDQSDQTETD